MTPEALIEQHPLIYHMAEKNSWPSIREHGLLSSNEVTNRAGHSVNGTESISRTHRQNKTSYQIPDVGTIVLRDQKPMPPIQIQRALSNGMSASDWYEIINERVFFWVNESRLLTLLNARQYRDLEHDVLVLNTESLIKAHLENVRLCHMNSGNTFPFPHKRDINTFKSIVDYPTKTNGRPQKPIVELTVLGGVMDIHEHVLEVRVMKGSEVLGHLPV
ncbi:DUF7002 family protein [Methylophaga sp.]|uniref:DUF7002 family protein n=1 Tax=Methylophaga sp. TaxID=2024840 RepID=UPI003F72E6C3